MTLQDEKRRLRELRLPPMSPAEEQAFQQKLTDTAAGDARLAQIGSTKTTMKGGAKIVNGAYKGQTPAMAQHLAITGAQVPTGKSGYVRGGPLTGGPGLPQRAPSAAPAMFDAASMAPVAAPAPAQASSTVASRLVAPTVRPPLLGAGAAPQASPVQAPAGTSPAAAIARAYTDNKNMGITGRDANGVQFDSGARIMPGANGGKTLVSPSGSGFVQFLPPGQRASDPVLAAETAAMKARQAGGVFTNGQGSATAAYAARKNMVPNGPQIAPPAPAPSAAPPPAGGGTMLAGPPSVLAIPDLAQGPPKAARGAAPTPAAVSTPNNMTPAGRMAIINAGISSLKPPAAPGPLTQVGGGSAPGAFAAAQTRLDQRAADGAIVGMTTDGMKLATGAVDAGVNAIAGTATAVGGIGAPMSKVGSALSKTLFGDPAARARLQKPPGPSAMPPARAAGGPVQAGKPYLVGEKGPELIVPQKSGTVVPNHDLPKTYVRDHAKGPGAMKPKEPRAAPTVPKTAKEATKMGLQDAVLGLQAMGQSAVNAIVPDSVLQGKQQRAAEDQAYRNDVNQARDAFDGGGGVGGFLTEAAVRLPGNIINTAAEVYSPSNKIAAATAGYHGVRKYAETGDATQAGIAAASNFIGEKLEDKAGPVLKSLIPKWPSNLAGNAVGSVLEKAGGSAVDAWRYGAAPAPISPPPPKPHPTLTAPVIAAAPRIAPYGPMPKMLSSSPARPAKSLQPPQLVMSR